MTSHRLKATPARARSQLRARNAPPLPGRRRSDGIRIDIAWRVRKERNAGKLLRRAAHHAAVEEGFRRGELSIAVIGSRAMASLHRRSLGIDAPTDVLTFDLGTERRARWIEGEIIVCADLARRRAARRDEGRGPAVRAELALYVVHGVLHLAGYDDRTPGGFRRMHAREDAILSELGLGRAFSLGSEPRS
jgi:probable rRNA maturation factor